jgi:putative ABC transport system permease protein
VVGVAASIRLPALSASRLGENQIFFPVSRNTGSGFTIIARTGGDRAAVVGRVKEAVWALDRSLPIMDVSLVEDALAESLSEERSNALLMVIFALTALTLGAIGIYGVVAYSVSRRIREMGIRLALGATAGGVVGRVVVKGMVAVGAGLALGSAGAWALGSTLAGLLVDVDPRDPVIFSVVAGVTATVALAATWLPARRAASASAMDAIRAE